MGQPSPQPAFAERSEEWGLLFRHRHGGSGERYMVETMVGGVVLLDFDGDGDTDVVFVDGGRLPHYGGPTPRTRLFRNDNGLFVDWTERSGLDFSGYGCGGVAADVDGDGDEDLYLTAFGQDALFLNMGDGSFSRAVDSGGLSSASWSSSAAFADADRDGDLDLYVASYVQYSLSKRAFCGNEQRGIRGYCHPDVYPGAADRFYRNDGSGRFEDATQAAGLGQPSEAGLGVVFGDLNGDLAPDLFVANDLDPNLLFLNRGDGTFENWSLLSGTAYGDRGKAEAGMGVEMADFDADGRLDLFVTNFALETNALYRNLGDGLFTDARFVSRLAEPSHRLLGFGTGALDVDHDGDLDLVIANGHILDNPEELQSETNSYSMPNQLFVNDGSGVFAEVQQSGLDRVRPSRGLALGDLDLDGDQDLVIANSNDRAEVYENRWGSARGAWLRVTLAGRGGNTAGIGARLTLRPSDKRFGSRTQTFEVRSGSSYLSRNELAIQFGVGSADTAQLTVVWPTAVTWLFEGLPTRRSVRLTESTVR